jgi:hypothetical protein
MKASWTCTHHALTACPATTPRTRAGGMHHFLESLHRADQFHATCWPRRSHWSLAVSFGLFLAAARRRLSCGNWPFHVSFDISM